MDINETAREIHDLHIAKGWWNGERHRLTLHMLMVAEIAEASECVRKGDPRTGRDGKPEGEAVELADCVIRIMDYFEYRLWDLAKVLQRKMDYNVKRTGRHDSEALPARHSKVQRERRIYAAGFRAGHARVRKLAGMIRAGGRKPATTATEGR